MSYDQVDNETIWKEVEKMLAILEAREGLQYKVMVPRYSAFQKCEEIYQDFQAQKIDYCPKCHAPLSYK